MKLSFVQKWALKSAWKRSGKSVNSDDPVKSQGILFIFPQDPVKIAPLIDPLRKWLADKPFDDIYIIIPKSSQDLLNLLDRNVTPIAYSEFDIKKNGIPLKTLQDRIFNKRMNIVVLLSSEVDILSEIFFALVPANLKAAIQHELRYNRVNFLVEPKSDHNPAELSRLLLDYIAQFALNQPQFRDDLPESLFPENLFES